MCCTFMNFSLYAKLCASTPGSTSMQVELVETIFTRIIERKSLRKYAHELYSQSHIFAESWSLNTISHLLVFVAIAALTFSSLILSSRLEINSENAIVCFLKLRSYSHILCMNCLQIQVCMRNSIILAYIWEIQTIFS